MARFGHWSVEGGEEEKDKPNEVLHLLVLAQSPSSVYMFLKTTLFSRIDSEMASDMVA